MYNSNLGLQGCCFSKKKSLVKKNHVNVWQKPLQYCKAISLQLIKIKKKKKPCTSCVYVFFFFYYTVTFFNQNRIMVQEDTGDDRLGIICDDSFEKNFCVLCMCVSLSHYVSFMIYL